MRALLAVPGHYAFAIMMGYYYAIYHFVDHSPKAAVKVFLVPVLAHGVYDSLAMSGTVDPVAGGICFFALIYFCIKLQKAAQKKVNELNKKIDDIVRKQADKASKTTLTKEQQLIAGGFEANKGRLPWPVEKGMISGHYGKQQHPVYSQVTIDNKGIYLQTVAGAKARSVYKGEVTSCFMVGGTYAVIIQHGNYRTVYSNLAKLSVKQGDAVDTKQNIGTIYTDPEQDQKTELYFQIYQDRNILNPELWIAR
jgi:septal ring factor EnvC (AmiA/AmiB activator)